MVSIALHAAVGVLAAYTATGVTTGGSRGTGGGGPGGPIAVAFHSHEAGLSTWHVPDIRGESTIAADPVNLDGTAPETPFDLFGVTPAPQPARGAVSHGIRREIVEGRFVTFPTTQTGGGGGDIIKAPPVATHSPAPEYPRVARQRKWEGRVLLEVSVAADGTVSSVRVKESSGRDVLDHAASDAVADWKFTTGGTVLVPVVFRLEN